MRAHRRHRRPLARALLCLLFLGPNGWTQLVPESPLDPVLARRQAYLAEALQLLPPSPTWEAWQRRTGELPPDFNALKPYPYLPDPLRFSHGKEVNQTDWPRRRQELLSMFQHFSLGTYPPPPGPVQVAALKSREETGAFIDEVTLSFGPQQGAGLRVEIILPKNKPTPLPVLIVTQDQRAWAQVAVSRGYIGCVLATSDSRDDTASWSNVWPGLDWTLPTRRAWAVSRGLDYLHTLPVVETNQIALAGHGAQAQSALIAGAMDRRLSAVILSSAGPGGPGAWRFTTASHHGPGLEWVTRRHPDWLHPRMRFFVGREDHLPIDQHELLACIAPRPCLISTAWHDPSENIWALEHSYREARRVYELFHQGHELNLHYRSTDSEVDSDTIETYLDWLDTVLERGYFPFPAVAVYPTYQTWRELAEPITDWSLFPTNHNRDLLLQPDGSPITSVNQWVAKRAAIRDRVFTMLGTAPPYANPASPARQPLPTDRAMLLRRFLVPDGLTKRSLAFGNGLQGDLYHPQAKPTSTNGYPCVIWLHPISPALGYVSAFAEGDPPYVALAKKGFAVFTFDQIGAGSRLEEVRYFYHRYPLWSLLGKQVDDALAGFEALRDQPLIDAHHIYAVGYGMGGQIALHAAALEPRLAGVITLAGFQPMRLPVQENDAGFVARWSRWYPLLPRLGDFAGRENQIPYDYHEILGLIAPRPAIIFQPRHDFESQLSPIRECLQEAAKIYERMDKPGHLQLVELPDYNHLSPETQTILHSWLRRLTASE